MKIKEINLFTNNILKQKQFYNTVLGFEISNDTPNSISFKTGKSTLVFKYQKQIIKPAHLAFNIPYNAVYDALKWLHNKVKVLDYKTKKATYFSSWKAKAVYFYDADKNIIEFIARQRIDSESNVAFTPRSIYQ